MLWYFSECIGVALQRWDVCFEDVLYFAFLVGVSVLRVSFVALSCRVL